MDELGWATVIARFVPFLLWSFVAALAPRRIAGPDRYRRVLVIRLVWATTAVLLWGSLAAGGLIPRDWGVTAYTMLGAVLAIVGVAFLWTMARGER